MYRDFYDLEYVPFTAAPDSDLVNLNRRHQAVLERVVTGLNKQQGIIAFTGEAGLGKIALLRSALAKYSDPKCKTILIDVRKIHFQNQIYFKDIVKAVYQEIGYEIKYQILPDTLLDLHDIFVEEREKHASYIIIINHAHLLPHEVLKSLPQLIDAHPYGEPVAQIVLAGEPALDKHLRDPRLQKLKKRIPRFAKLDTLDQKESIAYIQRKLATATSAGAKVFSSAAIRKIAKAANGIPRNLNMLCTDALVAGCRRRKKPIPVKIVKQVLTEYQVRRPRRPLRRLWLGAMVLLFLVLAAGFVVQRALPGGWQAAATWPQQAMDQVEPLMASLTQQVKALSRQLPGQGISSVPTTSQPVPTEDQVEPVKTVDVMVPPPDDAATRPMLKAPEASVTPPLPDHIGEMERVANLIDQHFPKGGAFGLKVWSDRAAGEAYAEGEKLVLHVMSASPAFLRIDYYQADGKIVHLLPNPLMSNRVAADQRFTLGGDGNMFQFNVSPPFGTEMLAVVASLKPIDTEATSTGELNHSYVDHLSRRLQTYGAQGQAAAAYIRIQTQP